MLADRSLPWTYRSILAEASARLGIYERTQNRSGYCEELSKGRINILAGLPGAGSYFAAYACAGVPAWQQHGGDRSACCGPSANSKSSPWYIT